MKKLKYFFVVLALGLFTTACEYDTFEDELPFIENALPAYVRFDPGISASINLDEGAVRDLEVQVTAPIQQDVTVTYSISGNAVFGQNFIISGAQANGGTFTIEHKQDDPANFDNFVITVIALDDRLRDGDKNLTITLESAVAADGTVLQAGQGSVYKTVNITIVDTN
ncbi:MAG: hypothetical protein ACFCUI_13145 [Bernardetiaceae bacterium]